MRRKANTTKLTRYKHPKKIRAAPAQKQSQTHNLPRAPSAHCLLIWLTPNMPWASYWKQERAYLTACGFEFNDWTVSFSRLAEQYRDLIAQLDAHRSAGCADCSVVVARPFGSSGLDTLGSGPSAWAELSAALKARSIPRVPFEADSSGHDDLPSLELAEPIADVAHRLVAAVNASLAGQRVGYNQS